MERLGYIKHLRDGAHIVFTGGEPLLQQDKIVMLLEEIHRKFNVRPYVEIETNGTITPSYDLTQWAGHFNVSPKLSNSGVKLGDRLFLSILQEIPDKSIFKFIITDRKDFAEMMDLLNKIHVPNDMVWLSPARGIGIDLDRCVSYLMEMACKHKFNYSI